MDKLQLAAIAREFGTPSFVFDESALACRMREIKEIVGDSVHLCYSIKANPFLIPAMTNLVEMLEVCSPGELTICEKTGMDMQRVIFSGVNKTAADVERAMDDGVGVFTVESWLHLQLINESALRRHLRAPVLVRLSASSQFSMDEADVCDLISRRSEWPGVEIVGLHFFTGTQKRKPALIAKELDRAMELVRRVEQELHFRLERLEYGTGLAVDYFSAEADAPLTERVHRYTGRESRSSVLRLRNYRIPLDEEESFALCETKTELLPVGGMFLPLVIERTTKREYEETFVSADENALKTALETEALTLAAEKMQAETGGVCQIIDKWVDYSMIDASRLRVRAVLEVQRNIASTRDALYQGGN